MTDYLPGYDAWKTTNSDDEFLGPEPVDEEELPDEPTVDEEWNASRGEYQTVVTFASGTKFALHQNPYDNWEVHGPNLFMEFTTEERALSWLTDIEHWGW